MKTAFFAVLLVASTILLAKAEPPSDVKIKSDLAETILLQLKTGQYDALEGEYQDFKDPRQHLPDGTPKEWVYFWSFEVACTNTPIADSVDFMKKMHEWLSLKPASIPALLCLNQALL